MRHAWGAYKRLAWGLDQVLPTSGRGADRGFALAETMVDALDTLWIMGLRQEFDEAKAWLAQNLGARIDQIKESTSVFETGIRTFGGLLSAYDLSREKVFLDLSMQLGRRIMYMTDEEGVTPHLFGDDRGGGHCPSLAESGSIQLEMRYLSHASGDESFAERADHFYETIRRTESLDGLWPNCFQDGRGTISFGDGGDSFYEYLVKVWHQGGQVEDQLWQMYDAAAEGLERHAVRKGVDGLTYLGVLEWDGASSSAVYDPEMQHLMCFVPGWLALGAMSERGAATRSRRMKLAADIAYTCWQMYERQPTGIGPEKVFDMSMNLRGKRDRHFVLRPEALEGWWYMHETTQDPRYRDWGWRTFLAFEKHLWVPDGYASLKDVTDKVGGHIDLMESFFLAETLKYLFLSQDPDSKIGLDTHVLNTEAHPLAVFKRAP
mmetsp:Transcript_4388/g.13872  ORF Transcript_4388/g.13872 Transcript_4388/m.13872 type:complete len:434 (+) Transcript_4388:20-1321(+)